VTKAEYAEYLRSDHWLELRRTYRAERPWQCRSCGEKKRLDLHHLTYKRLGKEHLDDLTPLCRSCHQAKHGIVVDGKVIRLPDDWRLSSKASRARQFTRRRRSRHKGPRGKAVRPRTKKLSKKKRRLLEENGLLHAVQKAAREKRSAGIAPDGVGRVRVPEKPGRSGGPSS
jgi:hypothetical protein